MNNIYKEDDEVKRRKTQKAKQRRKNHRLTTVTPNKIPNNNKYT